MTNSDSDRLFQLLQGYRTTSASGASPHTPLPGERCHQQLKSGLSGKLLATRNLRGASEHEQLESVRRFFRTTTSNDDN